MSFDPESLSVEQYQNDLVYEDAMPSAPINYYKRAIWLTSTAVALSLIGILGILGGFGSFGSGTGTVIFVISAIFGAIPLACTFGYLAAKNAAQALRAGGEHRYFKTLRVLAFVPFAVLLSIVIFIGYYLTNTGGWGLLILVGMVPAMVLGTIVALVVGLFGSRKLRKNNNDTEPRGRTHKIVRIILLVPITLAVCVGGYLVYVWAIFARLF